MELTPQMLHLQLFLVPLSVCAELKQYLEGWKERVSLSTICYSTCSQVGESKWPFLPENISELIGQDKVQCSLSAVCKTLELAFAWLPCFTPCCLPLFPLHWEALNSGLLVLRMVFCACALSLLLCWATFSTLSLSQVSCMAAAIHFVLLTNIHFHVLNCLHAFLFLWICFLHIQTELAVVVHTCSSVTVDWGRRNVNLRSHTWWYCLRRTNPPERRGRACL